MDKKDLWEDRSWKNIHVFISSTFNDMHAERDYLVKRVFPKLRIWCNERHLKLVDIDLRWGVREEDASQNKRVVEVCLKNIDRSRPFFLCLLGQRRGWVPGAEDVNDATPDAFPLLRKYLGSSSVTELEIIHALLDPLDGTSQPIRHSLFYFRDGAYLQDIEDPRIHALFSPDSDKGPDNGALERFKQTLREQTQVFDYQTRWDASLRSPELLATGEGDLSAGRLCEFRVGDEIMSEHIIRRLKEEILSEFPGRRESFVPENAFEAELAKQEVYLFGAADGYIGRPQAEQKILSYIEDNGSGVYLLAAPAGSGKTSLLAHLIDTGQLGSQVIYRFAGTTAGSSTVSSTLESIYTQLFQMDLIDETAKNNGLSDPESAFVEILLLAAASLPEEKLILILDAVDQWSVDFDNIYWIPNHLPQNVRLIISFKEDPGSKTCTMFHESGLPIHIMGNFDSQADKIRMAEEYLSQFLKAVDEKQMQKITTLRGSGNPLYLKIVLQELRIHGSFDTLMQLLETDYGSTPGEAFSMVLSRLEKENFCPAIDSAGFVRYVLGILACSRENLSMEVIPGFFQLSAGGRYREIPETEILDGVYALFNHLSPYLMQDNGRAGYLYDSFRAAVKERYRENLPEFYSLLAQLYDYYCNREGGGDTFDTAQESAISCLSSYVLEAEGEIAPIYYENPWFLLNLIRKLGAYETIRAYDRADRLGYGHGCYREIIRILRKAAPRINVCPQVIFYELKVNCRGENPVIHAMLSRIQKELDAQFLYPAYTNKASVIAPVREILLTPAIDTGRKVYIAGEHILQLEEWGDEGTLITVKRIDDEMVTRRLKLDKHIGNSYCDGEYLYVTYLDNRWETFACPGMESVSGCALPPDVPEDELWYRSCYGTAGVRYEICEKKKDELSFFSLHRWPRGELVCTYDTDGTKNSAVSSNTKICGPYFYIQNLDTGRFMLWHMPTGELVLNESLKEEALRLTYEAPVLYCVRLNRYSEDVCLHRYWKLTEVSQARVEVSQGTIRTSGLYIGAIGLCNGYLYSFAGEEVSVFDRNTEYIGRCRFPLPLRETLSSDRLLYYRDGDVLVHTENKLYFFSEKELHARAAEGKDDTFSTTGITGANHTIISLPPQHLAVFAETSYVLSLKEPKLCLSGENKNYLAGWSGIQKYIMGYDIYAARAASFNLQEEKEQQAAAINYLNLNTLKENISFQTEASSEWEAETTFPCEEDIAVVFFSQKSITLPYHDPNRKDSEKEYYRIKLCYYRMNYLENKFTVSSTWQPDILVSKNYVHIMTGWHQIWFIIGGVRIDETCEEIQVYTPGRTAGEAECQIRYRYPASDWVSFYRWGGVRKAGDRLIVEKTTYTEDDLQRQLVILDVKAGTVSEANVTNNSLEGGNDNEVYLSNRDQRGSLTVYSLKENRELLTFSTLPYKYHQIVLRKFGGLFLACENGMCRIYSAVDGHVMHEQLLEVDIADIAGFETAEYLYIHSAGSRYYLYRMGHISELDQIDLKLLSQEDKSV